MDPYYFTSIDDSEGWSKITYYTNKPKVFAESASVS